VLTAIIFSGITAYALLDSNIYFEDKSFIMPWGQSWLAVPLCGIAGGFLGALFRKITVLVSRLLKRTGIPIVVIALVCGGIIATVNYVLWVRVINKPRPSYTTFNLWSLLIRS
jgi:H+/Cl- antiporter ClcA